MGWLIAISGLDGAGKSTLIESLTERIEASGQRVKFVRIRLGYTPLLERLKLSTGVIDSNPSAPASSPKRKKSLLKKLVINTYRLWSILDLIWLFVWIHLLKAAGKQVITDRYYWDNRIIYAEKYGQPGALAAALWAIAKLAAGKPDAAFMLLIPGEESYRRVLSRNDGAAEEDPQVLERRARLYAELDQPDLVVIDALQPPEQVFQLVWSQLGNVVKNS